MKTRTKTRDNAFPAYIKQVLQAYGLGLIPEGCVTTAVVHHDDDCPALRGRRCRCKPDVEYRPMRDGGTGK